MTAPLSHSTRLIHLHVASRIRQRRRQVGMTQQQLARLIGVAFQQIHKYEHGLSRVSADRLYQIATALDAPVSYCFSVEDGLLSAEKAAAKQVRPAIDHVA
jgi:transcriptional regulator with XRE-family HTH domain